MADEIDKWPEHTKLQAVREQSQACGEFIDWLQEHGYYLGRYNDEGTRLYTHTVPKLTDLLADHFGIDQKKLEAEKTAMLDEIRKAHA
jgi:hypothetical protein